MCSTRKLTKEAPGATPNTPSQSLRGIAGASLLFLFPISLYSCAGEAFRSRPSSSQPAPINAPPTVSTCRRPVRRAPFRAVEGMNGEDTLDANVCGTSSLCSLTCRLMSLWLHLARLLSISAGWSSPRVTDSPVTRPTHSRGHVCSTASPKSCGTSHALSSKPATAPNSVSSTGGTP